MSVFTLAGALLLLLSKIHPSAAAASNRSINSSPFPIPPVQTPMQKANVKRLAAAAAIKSPAATSTVLGLLETPAFRSDISACCPDLASLSAEDLLNQYRAEVAVTEIGHCFKVEHHL